MNRIAEVQEGFFLEMSRFGIKKFDLGILRNGKFQQSALSELDLPAVLKRLAWVRAENRKGADIYFRPSAKLPWPIVFVDDLTTDQAGMLSRKYQCWIVETSPGRHHAWILTNGEPLTTHQRFIVQKKIVSLGWGDPGSVSGDHFGRIPGLRNMKRNGSWVNLISSPAPGLVRLDPSWGGVLHPSAPETQGPVPASSAGRERRMGHRAVVQSESEKELGWACGWLRKGLDEKEALRRLSERAAERGKRQPKEYAERTIAAARKAVRPN